MSITVSRLPRFATSIITSVFSIFAETISGDSLILDGKLLGACNSDLLPDIGLLLNMGRG